MIARDLDYYVDFEKQFRIVPIKASEMDDVPPYKNIVMCGVLDSSTDVGQKIIGMIRAALMPGSGEARLFIAGACKQTIRAFESYELRKVNQEYIDEPVKPQACDHPMDATRYYFVNRQMGKSGGSSQMGIT